MNNVELKSAAKAAAAQIVSPLVRLLLDVGLGLKDLQEIARTEFVRAAVAKGELSNPPATSDSDIAVVTGLTRRDVARPRQQSAGDIDDEDVGRHRAQRVLSGWCHDPEFQDELGNPARLSRRGPKRSFESVVRKHSPDPCVRTILQELERVRAVRRNPDGTVEVIRRTYAPTTFSRTESGTSGQQSGDHIGTLIHNLRHPRGFERSGG